jgi:NADH:ubiquinone oxidoreductase subunit 2 (subunit N)
LKSKVTNKIAAKRYLSISKLSILSISMRLPRASLVLLRSVIVLMLSLLSLAGIPPLAGFAGQVLLFSAALQGGLAWLAMIAGANMVL